MIVWLASYPRSGNTFFRRVVQGSFGLLTYGVYPEERERYIDPERARREPGLFLVKSHELPRRADFRPDEPVIYLVRDGRDAVISHAHFALDFAEQAPRLWRRLRWRMRGLSDFEGTLERLIVGKSSFGSWQQHVAAWVDRRATAVVRFEDLIREPVQIVQQAFRTLSLPALLPAPVAPPTTFADLNRENPKMFRKGRSGCWREEMPWPMQELFWRHNGTMMQRLRYAPGIDAQAAA